MDNRLTLRNSDGTVSQPTNLRWDEALEKLACYEDAEEEGRLIVLPKPPREIDLKRAAELILADEAGLIEIRRADGQARVETNMYDQEEVHPNCTVQVLRNSVTGEVSVGWWDNKEAQV